LSLGAEIVQNATYSANLGSNWFGISKKVVTGTVLPENIRSKLLNLNYISENRKKDSFSSRKVLRVCVSRPRQHLTGGAAMHQRGVRRARHIGGPRGGRIKSEVNEAGRAKEVRAHPVIFVSTLFEIDSI
jgi:hypothetical protein